MKVPNEKLLHLAGRLEFMANPLDHNDHTCEALNDSADILRGLAGDKPHRPFAKPGEFRYQI